MDTAEGLAVPVIKNVQNLNVINITKELNRLQLSGKRGTFAPDDLNEGTFTISNIGNVSTRQTYVLFKLLIETSLKNLKF